MFDGKILRGLTGTPMRRIDRAKSSFADAEPEPLTLANLTTKSLAASSFILYVPLCGFALWFSAAGAGVCHFQQELLHVPRACRAALGAHPAMQADVLVLRHDPAGLQAIGDVERLVRM